MTIQLVLTDDSVRRHEKITALRHYDDVIILMDKDERIYVYALAKVSYIGAYHREP